MNKTTLLYLNDFKRTSAPATVVAVLTENDRAVVILDQTIFYPQGGGQPYDQGIITGNGTQFEVKEVRMADGIVKHSGIFNGEPFVTGNAVTGTIDISRRHLHSRIHSAGHVLDKALYELGYDWLPGKSYHFPNGPYVEYEGSLHNIDTQKFKENIEHLCAKWAQEGVTVTSHKLDKKTVLANEQLKRRCSFIVDLPDETPIYVIAYGDNFASPCSGTHVGNVTEIGPITIRKIKETDGIVRISYELI